jgi:hypothetical protein
VQQSEQRRFGHNCDRGLFPFWDGLSGTAKRAEPLVTRHKLAGNPIPEAVRIQVAHPSVATARECRRPTQGAASVAPSMGTVPE